MKDLKRETWIDSATVCDRGLVRPENQDSFFSLPPAGLFLVADGMGGGQGGAQASALVAKAFREGVRADGDLAERLESVNAALAKANESIADYARGAGYRQTGSTAAVLLLGDELPGSALAVWVGDSRVYRIQGKTLTALTDDHTVANELFGHGRFGAKTAYSRNLPYAHVLTRALGVDREVRPDARRFKALADDRYLICSDGIHDMLPNDRICEIVASAATPQAGVEALADAVRTEGAIDNFTATLVFLKEGAK